MAADDEEVEAWYLEGWCFFLMAEQAHEKEGKLEDMSWEDLGRDSRDCLETCKVVCRLTGLQIIFLPLLVMMQLHVNQEHPDRPLLDHVNELITKLEELGIRPSPEEEADDNDDWEDAEGEDSDSDVEMS